MEYPERFCAFIDILGFRGYVASLGKDTSKVVALKNTLQMVHKPLHPGISDLRDVDYRTQSISDAVAISVLPTVTGLIELFSTLELLTMSLLSAGYFVRGAIAKGRLYHDEGMVFGEALIRAYDLETTVVRYPRIMITTDVAAVSLGPDKLAGVCRDHMRVASDGPRYLHVLHRMHKEMNDAPLGADNEETDRFGPYSWIKTMIMTRFEEALDNPRHFEKVQWFARYWNSTLPAHASSFRILGPGL
jgi:hypothetical protein